MALNSQDQQAIVTTHNTYRSDPAVNNPNLTWDSTLASGAQTWADYLASTAHKLQHSNASDRPGLGENIASATTGSMTPGQMVDEWGKLVIPSPPAPGGRSEQAQFKPGIYPDVSKDGGTVGHYSQMIWRTTTSVGCGFATDSTTGQDYLVCRYSPAGNMAGVGVPSPQPISLAQISVADSKNVLGVDASNNVYWFNSDDGNTWSQYSVTGQQMKQVSIASDYTVYGLDSSGAIWQYGFTSTQTWTKLAAGPVAFVSLSCGSASNLWAVGTDYFCYQNTGSGWTKIVYLPGAGAAGGPLITTAADGTTWWCDNRGMPARYTGSTWDWSVSSATGWTFLQLSCGSTTNVWGIGNNSQYYKLAASGTSWTTAMPGTGKQVSVASDGTVWSIGLDNTVSRLVNNAWVQLRF
ncbi:CAP domain-containing protein [Tengunoibacter tsumagoiensis]|uniref:SCP domain-containing protein n=1 Tax=Tengunoibacter tsumagoiensis TaxID=2014871 RepID=A0A402A8T3_9CHLR|nr:CAP domain-containing protein [Tengunoibacter tsumagoiensis]GCE15577.1 hypothetical protein KTT_54360 [Tengunoibacter tsumagoiensis]